jgi:hypothetical protein
MGLGASKSKTNIKEERFFAWGCGKDFGEVLSADEIGGRNWRRRG